MAVFCHRQSSDFPVACAPRAGSISRNPNASSRSAPANAWEEIRDTLGHELVHYWLDFHGKPCGHTPEFRTKLEECGFNRYSRLHPIQAKYLYLCPGCQIKYYRRRRGTWSCGPCSGPRYNPHYRLILTTHQGVADMNSLR